MALTHLEPRAETYIRSPERPIRVLTFTSLFPSSAQPRHGIFVETRLRKLLESGEVDARVVAPVPWFPFRHSAFGKYSKYAMTPRRSERCAPVSYPPYLMIPRLGVELQPQSMAFSGARDISRLIRSGWIPDIIDAHYLYPDGVAAAALSAQFDIPFVVTARGTDVNVLAKMPGISGRILEACDKASAVITVSEQLRRELVNAGADGSKITVLRNGVDLDTFQPTDRVAARTRLSLPPTPLLICVGNLVKEKGFSLAIEALPLLLSHSLLIVGDGPELEALRALSRARGVAHRVMFLPAMPQKDLRYVYGSADILLVTSHREGWPNVILEALACGAPVVSVDVGAATDILAGSSAGRIVKTRDASALASAILELSADVHVPNEARRHAEQFDWNATSQGQLDIFRRVMR